MCMQQTPFVYVLTWGYLWTNKENVFYHPVMYVHWIKYFLQQWYIILTTMYLFGTRHYEAKVFNVGVLFLATIAF